MNDILLNVLSIFVTVIIIPLITILGTKLIKWINAKVSNENAAKLLTSASTIVLQSVQAVFQTYVESLKASDSFDTNAQLTALEKAKETALSQMSDDVKNYIENNYGNLDAWLKTKIEATINTLKNK